MIGIHRINISDDYHHQNIAYYPRPGYVLSIIQGGHYKRSQLKHAYVIKSVRRRIIVVDIYNSEPKTVTQIKFPQKRLWRKWVYSNWLVLVHANANRFKLLYKWISENDIQRMPDIVYNGKEQDLVLT